MEDIENCNLGTGEFDWSQETLVTVIDAANMGDPEAKAELARREKQLGITSIATLSGNTEESSVFYAKEIK